jgi:hypothetical protein
VEDDEAREASEAAALDAEALGGHLRLALALGQVAEEDIPMSTRASAFWDWFVAHDQGFHAAVARWFAQRDDEAATATMMEALELVNGELRRVHPALAVNFGPPVGDGRHELVITVEGDREGMPAADTIVAAAPELGRWKLIKYKPAIGSGGLAVNYHGVELAAQDVSCIAEEVEGEIIVILLIPGLGQDEERDQDLQGGALVLLDGLVGEWRGLAKIDVLQCAPLEAEIDPSLQRYPLTALAERLDHLRPDEQKSPM